MVNMGRQLPIFIPASTEQQGFWKSTTYLAKIALILQGAPGKKLTFSQLMYRLAPLFPEDTKAVESNIRVCLSSNTCFVKIPMNPRSPRSLNSKKNYWKLDTQQVTEKMVRRHFRGLLEFFPELASKIQTLPSERASVCFPEAACKAEVKCEVKFSSPFSIESILKRDSPRVRTSGPSAPSTVPFRAEQQPGVSHRGVKRTFNSDIEELDRSSEPYPMLPIGGSRHSGFCSPGGTKFIRRKHVDSESWMYTSTASTGPCLSSHTIYSAPILCHGLFRSWV
ncbi:forkhead box protein I1-ema-like [Eucyclogobius newberryi]|uniref:forkhead box protein I1-ema-like n=1 Tax=Eucyclogobius newberryi TaxID=166745 RepID=UPI003B5B0CED